MNLAKKPFLHWACAASSPCGGGRGSERELDELCTSCRRPPAGLVVGGGGGVCSLGQNTPSTRGFGSDPCILLSI